MHLKNPCRNDRRKAAAAALMAPAFALVLVPLAAIAQDGQRSELEIVQPAVQLALNDDSTGAVPSGLRPEFGIRDLHRVEDSLDFRIRRISRELDRLDHDSEFLTPARPIALATQAQATASDLVPISFRIMSFLSIGLAVGGLGIVLCNRPELRGIRGKNETRDARRILIRCVVLLLVLNAADLAFTSYLVPTGSFIELNPLAEKLTSSLPALIAVKSAVIGCSAFLFLALWRHQIAQLASWGAATAYVFLAMWWVIYFRAATS